jgi:3-methyladenine DNA glycosylase AlkD
MNQAQVFELLEQNKNPRGIDNWEKMNNTGGLTSYGIGLTVQRKLAKKIGRNHELAQELWATNNYDAKVLGLLIDDPKQVSFEQAEQQVEQLNSGMLCHVFSSCDATLAKSPIAFELAQRWLQSDVPIRRSCGFGLVYEISKKKSKTYTDEFFISVIEGIAKNFDNESKAVKLSMGVALMGIGKRNLHLNQAALSLAKSLGPIDFNDDGQKCDPFNVVKHLTSDYLKDKLGINNPA